MKLVGLVLLLGMFIVSVYFYPQMPDRMAIHWNAYGEVDGYGGKFMGLYLLPLVAAAIFFLLTIIPRISVYDLKEFRKPYEYFILSFMAFFFILHVGVLIHAVFPYNFNLFVFPLVAAFLYFIGYFLKYCKRNYFVGIRTPWTLASEEVWDKTHQVGSFVFRIIPFAILLGVIFPKHLIALILISIVGNIIFFVLYSYFLYTKEKKPKLSVRVKKRKK